MKQIGKKPDDLRFYTRFCFHTNRICQDWRDLSSAVTATDRLDIVKCAKKLLHSTEAGRRELRGMGVSPLQSITQTDIVCSLELIQDGVKHLVKATQAEKRGQLDECNKHLAQWVEAMTKAETIQAGISERLKGYQDASPASQKAPGPAE